MKIKVVYFAYLVPNKWEYIINEQLTSLVNVGIYNDANEIYMSVVSDGNELIKLKKILTKKYSKIKLINVSDKNTFEYPGFKTLYEISQDEKCVILYFHSKGVTSGLDEARKLLFDYTIKNYKVYLNEFIKDNSIDVACAIPHTEGFAYYNFFWVNSEYVRNFCKKPEISNNRFLWETWIGSKNCNKKNVNVFSPIKIDTPISNENYRLTHPQVRNIYNKMLKQLV